MSVINVQVLKYESNQHVTLAEGTNSQMSDARVTSFWEEVRVVRLATKGMRPTFLAPSWECFRRASVLENLQVA